MNQASFVSIRVKQHLETFFKKRTIENASILQRELEKLEGENFQLIHDFSVPRLLMIVDDLQ